MDRLLPDFLALVSGLGDYVSPTATFALMAAVMIAALLD